MFQKVINGHDLEIAFVEEQGGGLEEAYLWCHTCNPNGDKLIKNVDLREDFRQLPSIARALMLLADEHAGLTSQD